MHDFPGVGSANVSHELSKIGSIATVGNSDSRLANAMSSGRMRLSLPGSLAALDLVQDTPTASWNMADVADPHQPSGFTSATLSDFEHRWKKKSVMFSAAGSSTDVMQIPGEDEPVSSKSLGSHLLRLSQKSDDSRLLNGAAGQGGLLLDGDDNTFDARKKKRHSQPAGPGSTPTSAADSISRAIKAKGAVGRRDSSSQPDDLQLKRRQSGIFMQLPQQLVSNQVSLDQKRGVFQRSRTQDSIDYKDNHKTEDHHDVESQSSRRSSLNNGAVNGKSPRNSGRRKTEDLSMFGKKAFQKLTGRDRGESGNTKSDPFNLNHMMETFALQQVGLQPPQRGRKSHVSSSSRGAKSSDNDDTGVSIQGSMTMASSLFASEVVDDDTDEAGSILQQPSVMTDIDNSMSIVPNVNSASIHQNMFKHMNTIPIGQALATSTSLKIPELTQFGSQGSNGSSAGSAMGRDSFAPSGPSSSGISRMDVFSMQRTVMGILSSPHLRVSGGHWVLADIADGDGPVWFLDVVGRALAIIPLKSQPGCYGLVINLIYYLIWKFSLIGNVVAAIFFTVNRKEDSILEFVWISSSLKKNLKHLSGT